jgi:hypothetical protein
VSADQDLRPAGPGRLPARSSYDIRIGSALSPALAASFPVRATSVVVPRGAVYRVRVSGQQDIADVVRRLLDAGIAVLEVHRSV